MTVELQPPIGLLTWQEKRHLTHALRAMVRAETLLVMHAPPEELNPSKPQPTDPFVDIFFLRLEQVVWAAVQRATTSPTPAPFTPPQVYAPQGPVPLHIVPPPKSP